MHVRAQMYAPVRLGQFW